MRGNLFDDMKELVGDGDIDRALAQLLSFLRASKSSLHNAALLVKSDLREIDQKQLELRLPLPQWIDARASLKARMFWLIDRAAQVPVQNPALPQPAPRSMPADILPLASTLEKIIGADRMMSLAWLRRGFTATRAVCRVETPTGIGTGFLVEGGVLVTNHHVLPDAIVAGRSIVTFNYEEGEDGNLLIEHRYHLNSAGFRADAQYDCAAVTVGDAIDGAANLADWGFLTLSMRTPSPGEFVTIIQHPSGGPKKIALSENQIVQVLPKLDLAHYTTDTYRGSSGAPVLDDRWQVVAVHHAGGDLPKGDGTGQTHYVNEGILASKVHESVLA